MAYLFDTGIFAANDSSGASLSGAKLTFYDNGTTTLKNTYPTKADAEAGTNANANPVVADANGRWGAIWLDDTFYTVKFQPADGSFTRTRDDIGGALAGLASTASGNGAELVAGALRVVRPEDYGAVGDGTTNDYAALVAANTAAVAAGLSLAITKTYRLNTSFTATADLLFAGGKIKPASGTTFTATGSLSAGRRHIFDISLGGAIDLHSAKIGDGYPEWFGAVGILGGLPIGSTDNRAALDACVAACKIINFGPFDYTITNVWKMSTSSRTLQGTAGSGSTVGFGVDTSNRYGMAGGTRIVLVGANVVSATVFQFGKDSSATDDTNQMRNSVCRDIVFARDCYTLQPNPSLSADPIDCVKGVIMSFCSDCVMERCWSYDSPVGFHTIGVVISKLIDCSVRRITPASSATHDFYVGFLHGGYGAANFGYIGNSASTYFIRCHVFDEDASFDTSWGMRLFGRFADTFVLDFEMARLNYGIEIDGRDAAGVTMSNGTYQYAQQDVTIENPVIDGYGTAGIWIHDTQDYFSITIQNPYCASGGPNLLMDNSAGSTQVHGGKFLSGGISATDVNGLQVFGTHIRDAAAPVVLDTCGMFRIEPEIFNLDTACTNAVQSIGSFRGRFAPIIRGAPGKVTYGVVCNAATDRCEVDGTMIDVGCLVGTTAASKVRYNGADATAGFSTNVLVGVTT